MTHLNYVWSLKQTQRDKKACTNQFESETKVAFVQQTSKNIPKTGKIATKKQTHIKMYCYCVSLLLSIPP